MFHRPPFRSPAGSGLRAAFAVTLAVALASCAPSEPPPQSRHFFPREAARSLFSDGYRHLADRYIEPVSLERLMLAGMEELHGLAPDVSVHRQAGNLQLVVAQHRTAQFPLPASNDSEAWADVTASVLRASCRP